MSESVNDKVSLDKQADILQATFEHYYRMAMDHHTKAATTSNILLVIVGAIFVVIGFDDEVCRGIVDVGSAIAVMFVGSFGAVWARKQHERYHFWEFIAIEYHKVLKSILPEQNEFKTMLEYEDSAKACSKRMFGPKIAEKIKDRHLWVFLHIIVVGIGTVLLALSILVSCPIA